MKFPVNFAKTCKNLKQNCEEGWGNLNFLGSFRKIMEILGKLKV